MASIYKSKITKKVFLAAPPATISASLAAASDKIVDGRIHEFVGIEKIPFRYKSGDQAKFIDLTKVETGSLIRDTERGIVYIPFKKKNFQGMSIGAGSFISTSFDPSVYLGISASFASKFSQIGGDTLITLLAEEFYTGSAGSPVFSATASYELRIPGLTRQSYSGIDTGVGVDFNIDNNSSFVTHGNFKFDFTPIVTQSIFFTSSLINFKNTATNSSSFSSHNFAFSTPASGSVIGKGSDVININSSSAASGTYRKFTIAGRFAGDADSGSLYNFVPQREIIIYSSSAVVASGSFGYHPSRPDFAKSQGVATELFYLSSSDNAGPSGSYTGSCVIDTSPLGSPIHSTANLRQTASYGFYYNPELDTAFLVSSSAIGNDGNAPGVVGGMRVPRIVSKSIAP